MRCPYCGSLDTQVKDSRPTDESSSIRRRRICPDCGGRFTTFERVQLRELTVVKRSGRRVAFDRDKLQQSVEVALRNSESGAAREWLSRASEAFERERLYLVRLTSAVGPIPSTPGAAETEASLAAQRNALEILATSERSGCPLGAAAALVGDWWPVRRVLDRAATRAGLDVPAPALPDEASVVAVIDAAADTPARERALSFGSDQLLLQHRGLFDLLEARATARVDADR